MRLYMYSSRESKGLRGKLYHGREGRGFMEEMRTTGMRTGITQTFLKQSEGSTPDGFITKSSNTQVECQITHIPREV